MARKDGKTMSDLSPSARAILDAGRNSDDPSDEQCERVRRSLLASVVVAGAAPLAASTTAAASVVKVVIPIAFVLTGAVGAGVWWYARQGSVPAVAAAVEHISAPALSPSAPPSVASASPAVNAPKVGDVVQRSRHTTASSEARATPAAPHNRLEEETKLLGQVNEALRAGDPVGAQALLDDYDQRFPAGVLREEMQATRVIARCQATPSPLAQEAARQFLMQHPASPLASRVASSCRLPSR
jgi:hypothetical protein